MAKNKVSRSAGFKRTAFSSKRTAFLSPTVDDTGGTLLVVCAVEDDAMRIFVADQYPSVQAMSDSIVGWANTRGVTEMVWGKPDVFPPGAAHLGELLQTIETELREAGLHVVRGTDG